MFDQIMTTFISILFVVLVLGMVFFAWVLWQIRDSLSKLFATIRVAWKRTKEDNYSRDEMIHSIQYFIHHDKPKSEDYWRKELARKYPEEPYNG